MSRKRTPRNAILEAALAALEEGDERALNMARVAKLVGISRQALYLHFENRTELAIALARYTDEKYDLAGVRAPLIAAEDGVTMVNAFARFISVYNPRIHKVVRMCDTLRGSDEAMQKAWLDRMQARLQGGRIMAKRLRDWNELAEGWTVPGAAQWITGQASTRLYEELVLDLGMSLERYRTTMALAMRRALLARA